MTVRRCTRCNKTHTPERTMRVHNFDGMLTAHPVAVCAGCVSRAAADNAKARLRGAYRLLTWRP